MTSEDPKSHILGMDESERRIIIPCKNPSLKRCLHRLVAPHHPDKNVIRVEVWCVRWRINLLNDTIECRCDPRYKVREGKTEQNDE